MNEIFTIGDFCFRIVCDEGIEIPENFLKFRGGDTPSYTYTIRAEDTFPEPRGKALARREDLLVMQTEAGECRYIGVKGNPEHYACYEETAPDAAQVLLRMAYYQRMACDTVFTSLLALERRQMGLDALVLHCAYIEYKGAAILFSAPSETGKTTQGNLWEKYRGARTVNGDKCLLGRVNGIWNARGWPVCGSSEICHNEQMPIRAIVMLSQAPEDRAERLSPMKAFTQIYSQITVNRWNRDANVRAMALLEDLIAEVPVYHLACTMNESAVFALETAIQ